MRSRGRVPRWLLAAAAIGLLPDAAGAQQARLSPADRELYAAILAMADTRALDTALVDRALAAGSLPVRAAAALAIGQVGRTAAEPRVSRLRSLLQDSDVMVAARAAYALGLLQDSASVSVLAAALRGAGDVPIEAMWSLGQIGEPAREVIVAELGRTAQPPVRVQQLLAAVKLRPVPLDAVLPHLRDSDQSVVWAAAYAVARPRVAAGVRALLELDARPAPAADGPRFAGPYDLGGTAPHRIRAEVARALSRQAAGDSLADSALATLATLARDPHPHVRINAIRSLATYEGQWRPVVAAFDDSDRNVRIAAVQALATAPASREAAASLEAMSRDTSFTVARAAVAAAFVHDSVPEWTLAWLAHPDWRRRGALAAAAAAARDRVFAERVAIPLLDDPDARVRASALAALTADTSRITDSLRARAVAALGDPDAALRIAALGALGRAPRADDVDAVIAALATALNDEDGDARVAALGYLTAAWRRDSSVFNAARHARFAALTVPADPVTHRAAANFPPLAAWSRTAIAPRPLAFYRGVVDSIVAPSLNGTPPRATFHTGRGPVTLELFGVDAPLTVHNLVSLARRGYYDNLVFHRVVPNFVAQDGDPAGSGSGGPGYSIRDELNPRRYERGVLGMALSGPDTGGSQYFITHSPQPHLDGGYTVFGRVVAGFAALDAITEGDRIVRVEIR